MAEFQSRLTKFDAAVCDRDSATAKLTEFIPDDPIAAAAPTVPNHWIGDGTGPGTAGDEVMTDEAKRRRTEGGTQGGGVIPPSPSAYREQPNDYPIPAKGGAKGFSPYGKAGAKGAPGVDSPDLGTFGVSSAARQRQVQNSRAMPHVI